MDLFIKKKSCCCCLFESKCFNYNIFSSFRPKSVITREIIDNGICNTIIKIVHFQNNRGCNRSGVDIFCYRLTNGWVFKSLRKFFQLRTRLKRFRKKAVSSNMRIIQR